MKVPRMSVGDGPETIVGFETEHRLLPLLSGPHVPRFVAAGDLVANPYLVMERLSGCTYQKLLDETPRLALDQVVALGLALARACHSLHRQDVVHQDLKPANDRERKLKKDLIEGFEDSGVALPADKRKRAKEIFDKLEELRQVFDRNVRDDPTKVTFTAAEMEGMPPAYMKAHEAKKDASGNYVLDLKYPSYIPFMQNAKSEAARKRYYIAKLNEGGAKNLDLLDEIFRLRKELAGLYDLPSYAHYVLRRRMVEKPEVVFKFLGDVKAAVTELEKKDIEELRAEKAKDTDRPLADTKVERWDVSYYQERVKRARYSVDQQKLRAYFPTDKSIDFVFAVSQQLYGVKFKEVRVPVWHPDVRYFDVLDAKSGAFLSGFYLDLFPRDGKYNHAAAFGQRNASRVAGRTPLSGLVTNFDRQGLDHRELETLMHEFGHVLHKVLSKTDYVDHGSVKRDFVEAPSQMFEEWARREQSLALFKQVCPSCPQLTAGNYFVEVFGFANSQINGYTINFTVE